MENNKDIAGMDVKDELNFDLNRDTNFSQTTNSDLEDLNSDKLLTRAVWITRLADDNLDLRYSTQELLSCGHSLVEVLDIKACQLIKKYVDEK